MSYFKKIKLFWPTARTWLVKTLLKKYLPKLLTGPWGWIVTIFGEKLFDRVLKPSWDFIWRKAHSSWSKFKRRKKAKKLEEAKNESDFDDAFDDMP